MRIGSIIRNTFAKERGYRLILNTHYDLVEIYPCAYTSTGWFSKNGYEFIMEGPMNLEDGKKLVDILNKL